MLHSLRWIKRKEMLKLAKSDVGRYEDLVYELLDNYRGLRDNSGELYLACIMRIRGREYINNTTLIQFFTEDTYRNDLPKVPSMASVIRLSTRLQKEHPHLRGKEWEKRQKSHTSKKHQFPILM